MPLLQVLTCGSIPQMSRMEVRSWMIPNQLLTCKVQCVTAVSRDVQGGAGCRGVMQLCMMCCDAHTLTNTGAVACWSHNQGHMSKA